MFSTLDICERIADKLSDDDLVYSYMKAQNHHDMMPYNELSLIDGWPGLAMFFSQVAEFSEQKKYEQVSHRYLERGIKLLGAYPSFPVSILQGLGGYALAIHYCSSDGRRYSRLRQDIDQLFFQSLDRLINDFENKVTPSSYSVAYGMSGIIPYLLLHRYTPKHKYYLNKCLTKLIEVMNMKYILSECELPGWFESNEIIWSEEEKSRYPKGRFSLGLFMGVSGVLSALSAALLDDYKIDGLESTISSIADWIHVQHHNSEYPNILSFEEYRGEAPCIKSDSMEGAFFIPHALYLAGKSLNDRQIKEHALNDILALDLSNNPSDFTFLTGKAGLMCAIQRMSQETGHYSLQRKAQQLEFDIINGFNPNLILGYETPHASNEIGLLKGVMGIALALMQSQNISSSPLNKIFLTR